MLTSHIRMFTLDSSFQVMWIMEDTGDCSSPWVPVIHVGETSLYSCLLASAQHRPGHCGLVGLNQ